MILNTGQRTDIPAFYSEWFYNRIKEGFVLVRNPYHPEIVTRFALNPEVVDVISFCTKNPIPMLPRLDEISAFRRFWFVTITPYGKEIEPHVPNKKEVIAAVKVLSERHGYKHGKKCVNIRYDPIFITEKYSVDYHIRAFEKLLDELEGYIDFAVFSFIDLYQKTKRNFPQVRAVRAEEQARIAQAFADSGKRHGIRIHACCEDKSLSQYGIDVSGCATKEVYENAFDIKLNPARTKPARAGCTCLLGSDIGAYNSCLHLCKYCYANYDKQTVLQNFRKHNPRSPLLIGELQKSDTVRQAKQESILCEQLTLC